MTTKGYKQSPEHVAARAAAVSKALKNKKQTSEHVAARQAGLAKVRAATVRVSKNDAAFLAVARQYFKLAASQRALSNIGDQYIYVVRTEDGPKMASLHAVGMAWADGEDVLLAKLAQ